MTRLFAIAGVVGFKSSAWIVVAMLTGHGVFDALHGHVLGTVRFRTASPGPLALVLSGVEQVAFRLALLWFALYGIFKALKSH